MHIGSFAGRTSQIGVEPTRQRKQNGDAPTTTTARTTRPLHARLSQPITAVVVVVVAAAAAAVVVVAVVVIKIPKAAAVTKRTQMWEELLPRERQAERERERVQVNANWKISVKEREREGESAKESTKLCSQKHSSGGCNLVKASALCLLLLPPASS